jgi:hypothetical protein
MFHVGLDIHAKRIAICALDEKGQVVHRSQVRSIQDMLRVLTDLPDRFEVCYEASCGYGHFHDLLHPLSERRLRDFCPGDEERKILTMHSLFFARRGVRYG